jgi:hypothetical protein
LKEMLRRQSTARAQAVERLVASSADDPISIFHAGDGLKRPSARSIIFSSMGDIVSRVSYRQISRKPWLLGRAP